MKSSMTCAALLAVLTSACQSSPTRAKAVATAPVSPAVTPPSTASAEGSTAAPSSDARFEAVVLPLPPERIDAMKRGNVWKPGCPVGFDGLVLLRLPHWKFEGQVAVGELVVAKDVAPTVVEAFRTFFELRFPIEKMHPIEAYGGSDDASMAANNTSAFNCRQKTGGQEFSRHSYGTAIDINPLQNPYVKGELVLPPSGADYVERKPGAKGLILRGPVTEAFTSRGWEWGGDWPAHKDYQHFEAL